MDLEILLQNGKPFDVNKGYMFLTIESSEKGSKIVNLETGKTLTTPQRLLEGFICHATRSHGIPVDKDKEETQYIYDIYCPLFESKEIKFSPTNKVYAIRLNDCQIVQRMYGSNEFFDLKAADADMTIENVLQVFDGKHMTIKEYASNITHGRRFDCWVTPIPSASADFSKWVLVPIQDDSDPSKWVFANPRSPLYLYNKLYEKMHTMFSNPKIGLGVVIGIGKIAVNGFLCNCPLEFELGSTRLCEYSKRTHTGFYSVVLTKSKPVKIARKYIETFITSDGFVLIKAVIGTPLIGGWKEIRKNGRSLDMVRPCYNYLTHPFLGKIIFSTRMLWSSSTLRVLLGGTVNVTDFFTSNTTTPGNSRSIFDIRYHVIAFHDGQQYWRVPDVPDEIFHSKNFLIEHKVPLLGQPDIFKKNISSFAREVKIPMRVVSGMFDLNADQPDDKNDESDDEFVTASSDQKRRGNAK